jgi:O-succinylbenzoate synthase
VATALDPFGKFKTVKIKIAEPGQTLNDDLQRIWQVRKLFGDVKIRLDANGALSVENAFLLANTMIENGVPIEYLEQPCATIEELAQLRKLLSKSAKIKVAADESVRKMTDPLEVARAGAADILVLKAAPLGGVTNAIKIAESADLPVVVSSALESSVGLSMGLHLAACLDDFSLASGLATAALLAADLTDKPLIPKSGYLPVERVNPSKRLLDQHQASPERRDFWLERLSACHSLLLEPTVNM